MSLRGVLVAAAGMLCLGGCGEAPQDAARPALVLLVTVDQLRGDMPGRYMERFGEGGFRRLARQGAWFREAHYAHGITLTCPGFATLATGATPAQHGIVGNGWFDRERGTGVYCVGDPGHALLGEPTAAGAGTSPRNLSGSTVGDELVLASHGRSRSRVFSVALKDRAAILLAGRAGKAVWHSGATGRFVTSDFYYATEPAWLKAFNEARPWDRYRNAAWDLVAPRDSYANLARDDLPWERDRHGLGRVFPHDLGAVADEAFPAALRVTPFADELVLELALELLGAERLGRTGGTDFLAVGFSATDIIGHAFGPESLEAEDNLLRVDRLLARLLDAVDEAVGLERTLVVLSADHGAPATPEALVQQGFAVGRLDGRELAWALREHLAETFGTAAPLVAAFEQPSVYLDEAAMWAEGLDPTVVEETAAAFLAGRRGVYAALARSDLLAGRIPADPVLRDVALGFHRERSGHLLVVPEPGWYLHPDRDRHASMHGSPWTYDRHVPVFFAGPGVVPGPVDRRVRVEDVAPTMSRLLGIAAPSASIGTPLFGPGESPRGQSSAPVSEE